MDESTCLSSWQSFYSSFQNSKILFSQASDGCEIALRNAGTSLLFDTGGEYARELFKNCGLLGGDIVKLNYILWKLEEASLPKVIVMFERFKQEEKHYEVMNPTIEVLFQDVPSNSDALSVSADAIKLEPESIILTDQHYVINNFNYQGDEGTHVIVHEAIPEANISSNFDHIESSENINSTLTKSKVIVKSVQNKNNRMNNHKYLKEKPLKPKSVSVRHLESQKIHVSDNSGCRKSSRHVKITPKFLDISNVLMRSIKPEMIEPLNEEVVPQVVVESSQVEEQRREIKVEEVENDATEEMGKTYPQAPLMCSVCKDSSFKNPFELKLHWAAHEENRHQPKGKPFTCDRCDKNWSTYLSLKLHYRKHTGEKRFKCSECGKRFRHPYALREHNTEHFQDSNMKYLCIMCGKSFHDRTNLENHMAHHVMDRVSCNICGKSFASFRNLDSHMKIHSNDRPYRCKICPKAFVSIYNLKVHETIHTGEKNYSCGQCGKSYRLKTGLEYHLKSHNPDQQYKCEKCPKTFMDARQLEKHMDRHMGVKFFSCELCGKQFLREKGYENHKKLHDNSSSYACEICNKLFLNKSVLNAHLSVHTGEKQISQRWASGWVCMFRCLTLLKPKPLVTVLTLVHLRAHRGEKTHVCELCGERFVNPNSLKVHYRRHTGEKPYKCSFCPKSFSQQGTLIAHERYHKGEKPYLCGTCGEGFTTRSHLTIHVRKHTNDRPYKCDQCDYAGTTRSLLNIHLLRHSSNKPFKCTVCSAAFKRQHHLDGHLRKHSDREQMYPCSFCDHVFISEEKLNKHMKCHEIVVVSTVTEDDIFHVSNTNRDEGPVEVAYDIILL
uniref:C2H2-type domain-containing protein n=1 Tax=Biomphalaria glabrata TaxID=6526 RepID=A0A2C9KDV1_BIOGL